MPYRPKGSLIWWTSKPWRESTGTRDEEQAKLYEAQLVIDAKRGIAVKGKRKASHVKNVDQELLLAGSLDRWLAETGKRSSYHFDLNKGVVDAFGATTKLDEIDNEMIAKVVAKLIEQRNAASTINKKLRRLEVVREHAAEVWGAGLPKVNFSLHRRPKAKTKHTFYLSQELEAKVLELYAKDKDYTAFIIVSIETGMRTSEVLQLTEEDLDFAGRRVHVRDWHHGQHIKTGEVRSVPMTHRCFAVLAERKGMRYPFGMFRDDLEIRKLWQAAVDKFNLPTKKGATPRCFRRTCGTRLAEMGFSQAEIAAWLGHKSTASTEHYVNIVSARVDRMRELIDNARPVAVGIQSIQSGFKDHSKSEGETDQNFEQKFELKGGQVSTSYCFSPDLWLKTCLSTFWEQDVGSSNLSTPTNTLRKSTTYSFKIDQEELNEENFE